MDRLRERWVPLDGHVRFVVFRDAEEEKHEVVDVQCTAEETLGAAIARTERGVKVGPGQMVRTKNMTWVCDGYRWPDTTLPTKTYDGSVIVLRMLTWEHV